MSYVVSIQRASGKPPLTEADINGLIEKDASLSRNEGEPAIWIELGDRTRCILHLESDHLWTDDIRDNASDEVLEKLRQLAGLLDAGLYGEEGEDLMDLDADHPADGRGSASWISGCLLAAVSLPFFAVLLVLRLPWVAWKLFRETR